MERDRFSSVVLRPDKRLKLSPIASVNRSLILGGALASSICYSATVEVTSYLDDNGDGCTLREAVEAISIGGEFSGCIPSGSFDADNTILFSTNLSSNEIALSRGQIHINDLDKPLTIDASAVSGGVIVDGNLASRVFLVQSVNSLSMDNLTITGGVTNYSGAGIYAFGGTTNLSLNRCTVSGNSAGAEGSGLGGGIQATGVNVSLVDSRVLGNSAEVAGGGISSRSGASVTLANSVVSGNSATRGGGLHTQTNGTINLTQSTVSENSAQSGAGVSVSFDSSATIENSTISGNSSSFSGGGLYSLANSSVSITNSTVSGNSSRSSGGLYVANGEISLFNTTFSDNEFSQSFSASVVAFSQSVININNSIIANSGGLSDCLQNSSSINTDLASVIEDGSCGASRVGDPGLLSLSDNGGETFTHRLSLDSIARGTGILATCTATDQLGEVRDNGDGLCDVGAVESNSLIEEDDVNFYIVPIQDGNSVVVPL